MSTYVLIPGAGGAAWYWHRVLPLLRHAGHRAVAVDLPGADARAGLAEYAQLVSAAIEGREVGLAGDDDRGDVVVVAQSLGGFTAPLVAGAAGVRAVVLVNAMIPLPGETPGAWWEATGWEAARVAAAERGGYPVEFDVDAYFLHDVPPDVAADGEEHQRPESEAVFGSPCAFDAWPAVPVRIAAGADDRFFPAPFQQAVARDRLGLAADLVPGGHLNALAQPAALTDYLLSV